MYAIRTLILIALFISVKINFLQAQWIQSADLNGGEVNCFAVSDTNIFAGTFGGGVFLSTDNGMHWRSVNSGLTNTFIRTLAVRGTNIFAGTSGGGIFISTNNGETWTGVNNGLTTTYIQSLIVKDSNLYTGTQGHGIFLSTNNGSDWHPMNNGLTNGNVRSIIMKGSDLFAGVYSGGVFRSTDNGMSWHETNNGLTNLNTKDIAVVGSQLFVASHGGGIFRSTDNGESWNPINQGLPDLFTRTFAVYGTTIFVGIDGSGIFFSTDFGSHWIDANSGLTNSLIFTLFVHNSILFAGSYTSDVWKKQLTDTNNRILQSFILKPGWNLISTPVLPDSFGPETLFPNNEAVFRYDNSSFSYTAPGNIELGYGYWAYYTQADTLIFSGIAIDSIGINISKEGWIIFGSRTISSPISSLVSIPSGSISGDIFRYNSTLQQYQAATEITPGEGYWIYVTQPCKLMVQ